MLTITPVMWLILLININNTHKGKYNVPSRLKISEITICTRGCRGRDRMVVGFTTTYAISAYHH